MADTHHRSTSAASATELARLLEPGYVYELRTPKAGRYRTASGYFDDFDALAAAAATWDGKAPGIYVTLNPVNPALLARAANRAKPYAESTTSDGDVARRLRLLVDVDPRRPSGIASTDAEHAAALEQARRIRESLCGLGWPDPILMDSGNGAYLVYALDLPNDAVSLALVNGTLAALAQLFGDSLVKIDTTVGNAARIARIPGTLNAKGDSTAERPHRRSQILEAPEQLVAVPQHLLDELAMLGAAHSPDEQPRPTNGSGRFDLAEFMARHGLEVRREKGLQGTRVLELVACPFNREHTGGCAAIFERSDGRLGFRCHHDSCNGRGWRALRDHLERGRESTPSTAQAVPAPAPEAPDLRAILADLERLLSRFVVFASKAQIVAVLLWIVHTHVFDHGDATPYLAITSPEKRSGKTRVLDVLELVVARPWRAVLPSEAVVYRKIEADAPTLLLDEVDAIYGPKAREHEGLRALLNAGHRRGSKVPRCVGKSFTLEEFETFCPKALAGIGKLPDTVADRSIPIRLARRKPSERVERFRRRDAAAAAAPLHERLTQWATQVNLSEARPALPQELDDRAADGWEPLLAIADAAGGEWPARGRDAAKVLHGDTDPEAGSLGVRLLSDCREVFAQREVVFTEDLVAGLQALETAPWADLPGKGGKGSKPLHAGSLARLLRPYDVLPGNIRIGGVQAKGYSRAAFRDAWERYLAPRTGSEPSQASYVEKNEAEQRLVMGRVSQGGPTIASEPSQENARSNGHLVEGGRRDGSERQNGRKIVVALGDGSLRAEWEERAAILELDGGLTREEAEEQAAAELGLRVSPAEAIP